MKFNSTVALTLILLAMMLGAGFVSSMWGFAIGHAALKGVTQPDVRPTKKNAGNLPGTTSKEGVPLLREADIIKDVKAEINGRGTQEKREKAQEISQTTIEESPTTDPSPEKAVSQLNLPIKAEDRGVSLEVRSAESKGGTLLLNVTLKNQGASAVQFLYSFLNVTDDQGRALSAVTDGLPGELPADGKEFSGTVSIPTALLEDAKKLSLTLTDYPEQKLQLRMSDIPVTK